VKVMAITGSPRKGGNTEIVTAHALAAIAEEGLETEMVSLAGKDIRPCIACMTCAREERCPIDDDLFPIYERLKQADGIILASPVYYGSATSLIKAFMERAGYISRWNGTPFQGKAGGALAVARRAGKNFTFSQLTLWFQILGFYIPGSTYWNVSVGRDKGDVESDSEGMATARNFGKNMAHLVKKLNG